MKPAKIITSLVLASTLVTAAAPRTVNCRVVKFDRNPEIPAEIYALGESKDTFTKINPSQSVDAVPVACKIPENGELRFVASEDAAGQVIATAILPPKAENAYLFLMADPTPDDSTLFQVVAIEDSPEVTPPGGAMFHNSSDKPARVTVAGESHPLPANETLTVLNPADKDKYNMAQLKIEVETDGKWAILQDSRTRFSMRDLYLVLITDTAKGRTDAKVYSKSVPVKIAP